MSITSEKEDLATCPYNPSHKIAKFKLLPHVHRCKDGLKSTKKLYHCKKDSLIMFFADKKEEHIKDCQNCLYIYHNLNTDQSFFNNSNSYVVKKKPNYLDDQKSISLLTGTDENNTITLNLDDMSELNASIISTPSIFTNFNNQNNEGFGTKNLNNNVNRNEIKYQFYSKNDEKIISNSNNNNLAANQARKLKDTNVNEVSKDFGSQRGSEYNLNRAERDSLDGSLDETKFSRKI